MYNKYRLYINLYLQGATTVMDKIKMFCNEENKTAEIDMIFKIQKKEWLEDIAMGKLYMKPLNYFRKLEEGIGDPEEGLLFNMNASDQLEVSVGGIKIEGVIGAKAYVCDTCPIFCCASFTLKRINNTHYQGIIKKQFLKDFMLEKNASYGIICIPRKFFENKVSEALSKISLNGYFKNVKYSDEREFFKQGEEYKAAFRKRTKFSYQNECRLLVNTNVQDDFILNIGDIREQCKIIDLTDCEKEITIDVIYN